MDKIIGANLNLDLTNVAACLKASNWWGHTDWINVCNGHVQIVPWGTTDWTGVVVATLVLGSIGLVLLAAVTSAIAESVR